MKKLKELDPEKLLKMDKEQREEYVKIAVSSAIAVGSYLMLSHMNKLQESSELKTKTVGSVWDKLKKRIELGGKYPLLNAFDIIMPTSAFSDAIVTLDNIEKTIDAVTADGESVFNELEKKTLMVVASTISGGLNYWLMSHPAVVSTLGAQLIKSLEDLTDIQLSISGGE